MLGLGVPLRTPVAEFKASPRLGRVPAGDTAANDAAGGPAAVKVKLSGLPAMNVVLVAPASDEGTDGSVDGVWAPP